MPAGEGRLDPSLLGSGEGYVVFLQYHVDAHDRADDEDVCRVVRQFVEGIAVLAAPVLQESEGLFSAMP